MSTTQPVPDRWVRRNEDKPHRCPECHAVVRWGDETAGPRTVLHHCGVQWRYGRRITRRESKLFLLAMGACR